jgi:hypothetical protein
MQTGRYCPQRVMAKHATEAFSAQGRRAFVGCRYSKRVISLAGRLRRDLGIDQRHEQLDQRHEPAC